MPKKSRAQQKKKRPRPESLDEKVLRLEAEAEADFESGKFAIGLAKLDQIVVEGFPTARTWLLIGRGLVAVKEYAQAVDALERALVRNSDSLEVLFNLAGTHYQLGQVDHAVELFEKAALEHGSLNAWGNLATIIPGAPSRDNSAILKARKLFALQLMQGVSSEVAESDSFEALASEKIRIGYVSAYFHRENYMKPVASLIREHDRDRFEVHLFSDYAADEDIPWFTPVGEEQVHVTTDLDNDQLAELIRDQRLDVLIDLNAYSVPTRLPIYAYRLARKVLAWFNMYATSGMKGIDYIVGDQWVVPPEEDSFYTEQVIRLPNSYLTFDVNYEAPPVVAPPSLFNERFTFGSLISQYKITDRVYDCWARILRQVPQSRLVIANRFCDSSSNRDWIMGQFQQREVEPERIELRRPAEHRTFLKNYDDIDLALDAFPYNGGTTTTEAIWQGVPVLSTLGDRWAARTSRTLLANAGLEEFVAKDEGEYISKAVAWSQADKRTALAELRSTMRERLKKSPVCDSQSLSRAMEATIRDLLGK